MLWFSVCCLMVWFCNNQKSNICFWTILKIHNADYSTKKWLNFCILQKKMSNTVEKPLRWPCYLWTRFSRSLKICPRKGTYRGSSPKKQKTISHWKRRFEHLCQADSFLFKYISFLFWHSFILDTAIFVCRNREKPSANEQLWKSSKTDWEKKYWRLSWFPDLNSPASFLSHLTFIFSVIQIEAKPEVNHIMK